jgi:hypothetical protein
MRVTISTTVDVELMPHQNWEELYQSLATIAHAAMRQRLGGMDAVRVGETEVHRTMILGHAE